METLVQVLIPCKISQGMFDSEYAVEITLPDSSKISLFADKGLVQEVQGNTYLRVNLVQEHNGNGERRILLPSETFETGSRWVDMPSRDLVAA
jgi:hypothetical protein